MNKSLFKDFENVSSKVWKQKIQADLKGADYNESLLWTTSDGITVRPFYHSDEFKSLPGVSATKATEWKILQLIDVTNAQEANQIALDAINRGAESILFNINSESVNPKTLLKHLDITKTAIEIKTTFLSERFCKTIFQKDIRIHTDIIGHLVNTGNWFISFKEDHLQFKTIVKQTAQCSVDGTYYQNAGATIVQQLAYSLAHANEYLHFIDHNSNSTEKQSLQVHFNMAIGSNYFLEIAKLRALRQLWHVLASEYQVNTTCTINATPSKRNKTIYDYNVNMLRTTTECMSAVLGGANTVCNLPYDSLYHRPNEFGNRISRNQLLVLKNESYFDKVNNPADGSYYIENLTQQLVEKALNLFKAIEAKGGFLKQLKSGLIQRKIKESARKEQADFDAGKLVLLGTNTYQNPNDRMKENLEISPFLKREKRKTIIEPIIEKRLSETMEINRLKKE